MKTATIESSARISYYHLLLASYQRARIIMDEMLANPEKVSPERLRDTAQYLARLQAELERYKM
ncbi:hypothetical protein [Staphylospora marina]|uniref:hypothetical protein n=1 Tax=Staphylospora marina TaxID=2490858 RepID=UPI000F5B8FEE|nr:hypothetical protein [Staphylospora marina]